MTDAAHDVVFTREQVRFRRPLPLASRELPRNALASPHSERATPIPVCRT